MSAMSEDRLSALEVGLDELRRLHDVHVNTTTRRAHHDAKRVKALAESVKALAESVKALAESVESVQAER